MKPRQRRGTVMPFTKDPAPLLLRKLANNLENEAGDGEIMGFVVVLKVKKPGGGYVVRYRSDMTDRHEIVATLFEGATLATKR